MDALADLKIKIRAKEALSFTGRALLRGACCSELYESSLMGWEAAAVRLLKK